jgi:hypothetical protein
MNEFDEAYVDCMMARYPFFKNNNQQGERMLIRGTAKWAKVTGEPVWGYEHKHREWSIDVYTDEETNHRLEVEGLKDKIKDKGNGTFMTFKRRETKLDGSPNNPIRVVDHHGEPWDAKRKIGNGSTVNVNFAINEYGKGQKSANILSLQVWNLVPYEGAEFPTREDDEDWSAEVKEEAAG